MHFAEEVAGLAAHRARRLYSEPLQLLPFSHPVDLLALERAAAGTLHPVGDQLGLSLAPGLDFTYAIVGEVVASVAPRAEPAIAIAVQPNGDVTVTFTGTLEMASTLEGPFLEAPGNPQGVYTIPKAGLTLQQFFRASSG